MMLTATAITDNFFLSCPEGAQQIKAREAHNLNKQKLWKSGFTEKILSYSQMFSQKVGQNIVLLEAPQF